MTDKPESLQSLIAELATAQTIALNEVVMALHQAKLLDKSVVSQRWRAAAEQEDKSLTPAMRKFLELTAGLLDGVQEST